MSVLRIYTLLIQRDWEAKKTDGQISYTILWSECWKKGAKITVCLMLYSMSSRLKNLIIIATISGAFFKLITNYLKQLIIHLYVSPMPYRGTQKNINSYVSWQGIMHVNFPGKKRSGLFLWNIARMVWVSYLLEDKKGKQEHEIYRKNGFSIAYEPNYYE